MLLPLILLSAVGFSRAEEPPSGVDLDKTRTLFEGWTLRERFPDSVTLAYYSAHGLQLLGTRLSEEKTKAALDFVRACQRDDGGFVSHPKFGGRTNLIYTFFGLQALDALGARDGIDREPTAGYVAGLAQEDGGISPSPGEKGRGSLGSTFYGVGALALLGRLDRLDKDKTAAFVLAHRTSDDGFAMNRGGASSPQATAMAVDALSRLGALNPDVRAGAVRYLEGAVAFLGTLGPRYRSLATMQSATAIADALTTLGAIGEVETAKLKSFVVSLYIPQNGGFGPSPSLGTTPPSTYQGVRTLAALGALKPASEPKPDQPKP